ncbi:MAG: DUF4422 domain-containing protein [Lachnospiraceae bacterium]|nr:DUF4422 domain-containing protein [Lachnospiraceae bacterium]
MDFKMYEVRSDRDSILTNPPILKAYECPIQAGCSIAKTRMNILADNIGENISEKNRQYCEMTAVYWIWKNRKHDYVGIEHYRRHLLVTKDLLKENMDVIMPLPYMCYPNEKTQFLRFVSEDVLSALLDSLRKIHPQRYDTFVDILNGQYQYTYNMLCAKWDVFCDYCEWFFEISEYMENIGDYIPDIKNTRALSYVAEVLTNLYFMSHKNLNILHVGKEIYI